MIIDQLLQYAVDHRASDLHLSSGLPPRVRIDGDLQDIPNQSALTAKTVEQMVDCVLPEARKSLFETTLEADFSYELKSVARFRVNAFHQSRGISAVFRVIPEKVMSLDELHLPEVFRRLCLLDKGLVLVTGPTGCGKSTMLAAMVDYINTQRRLHILTMEDPIEFYHQSKQCLIQQREVGQHTPSFSSALRSALREDPDVILVGEMRDLETIRLALTAAETGHLVLATLHTSSAPKAINRIIDVFPAEEKTMVRSMLSESLQAVIAQVLVKKKDGGRVAAHEIMLCTPAVRNLIREDKIQQLNSVLQTGKAVGMITMQASLKALVDAEVISEDSMSRLIREE